MGWGGLNPNLVSALAPFGLVRAGAEIGAELDNKYNNWIETKLHGQTSVARKTMDDFKPIFRP